jgi:hypothetical protein
MPRIDNFGAPTCRDCWENALCVGCGRVHFDSPEGPSTSLQYAVDGGRFCQQCASTHLTRCAHCNRPFSQTLTQFNDVLLCSHCLEEVTVTSGIHCASYKPIPQMLGKGKLFFGFELETEVDRGYERDAQAQRLAELVPNIYCKSDGSLDYGFEIVTQPFSFEWLGCNQAFLDPIWKLTNACCSFTPRCGFHIHMSKDAFSQLHLFRFMKFFYLQSELVRTISQRISLESLDRWASFRLGHSNTNLRRVSREAKRNEYRGDRYAAVNLRNEKTIELRVFQGILNKYAVFKNVEFAHAIYSFTKNKSLISLSNQQQSLNDFYGFIVEHQQQYPHLVSFLVPKIPPMLLMGVSRSSLIPFIAFEVEPHPAQNIQPSGEFLFPDMLV